MKRIVALAAVLLVSAAGLYLAQRRQHGDSVNANAVLDLTADWQRDLTRAPMRLTRLSDAQEIRIGDELAQQYLSTMSVLTPQMESVQSYVATVGSRAAAQAHRKLPYRFHIIADPNYVNAFALPGGHVFIGLGLLNLMTTEDELAFVLGHETEHIDHYHAVERVQIEARLHKLDLDIVAGLAQIPMSLWQAGYSKDEEFEADREGLRIAAASGYSPQGAIDLLTRFLALGGQHATRADTPGEELNRVAIEGLQGYFRSHPETAERLAQVRQVIADDHLAASKPLTPLNAELKKMTERVH